MSLKSFLILSFLPPMLLRASSQDIVWHDASTLPLEGKGWTDTASHWSRLPLRFKDKVTPEVWNLSRWSAGLALRFRSTGPIVRIRWRCVDPRVAWPHIPATCVSGIDVYSQRDPTRGWRYEKCQKVWDAHTNEMTIAVGRDVPLMVYLPTYNGIDRLEIGISPGERIEPLGRRPSGSRKPIVVYGTSITEGACASRAGMGYAMILARDLDLELVNLGFAGAARQEPVMADIIAEIDAAVYVIDCMHNMDAALVSERFEPFLRRLHSLRPSVPIVTAEACSVWMKPSEADMICRRTVEKLKAENPVSWSDLCHVRCEEMYPDDGDASVDGCHPNDWGMKHIARAFEKAIRPLLRRVK